MSSQNDSQNTPRRGRGRPRSGNALSDAERARRYRAKRKQASKLSPDTHGSPQKNESETVNTLRDKLAAAENQIRHLQKQLALFVTENDTSGRTWSLQERRGNARWQTFRRGMSKSAATREFERVVDSHSDKRYSYRMIEDYP